MSLDTLPLELLHQIARVPYVLRQPDFLSLSRVSKRLLPFARSHLYRSVRLFISAAWFDEKRDDFDRVGPEKFTRDLFFRTITDAPHLASKITTLSLIIDPKSLEASWNVCQGNYDITDKTIEFLRACINLTNLTLERPGGTGDGDTPFEIIYAIPTTVRTFRIRNRPVGPLGLARLLSHLSSLFELDLSQSTTIELEQTRLPVPGTLTVIRLPGEDTKLFPFLREIVDAIPSLRSFDGPPASLEMLIRRPLEPLKQLTIRGFVDPSRDQVSYDQLLLKIVTVIRGARTLQQLSIQLGPGYGSGYGDSDPAIELIRVLPRTIEKLDLCGPGLYSTATLLTFLGSDKANSMRSFISYPTRGRYIGLSIQDVEIETSCRNRGIRCKWVST